MATAPSHVVDIIKGGRPDGLDTTSLFSCMIGGATISKKFILELRDLLPGTFVAMAYGQTEVAGLVTVFQIKYVKDALALHYKPESVGRLIPGMMCKVREGVESVRIGLIWIKILLLGCISIFGFYGIL